MAIEVTEIFYPKTRTQWRRWLERHHASKTEIWVRRFRKATGKPCLTYDELVEECLCFGWIDGVVKKMDDESNVQRITPRRKKGTSLSELNRQRIWKLQQEERMTEAGLAPIAAQVGSPEEDFEIPREIEAALREADGAWENFLAFPRFYQRLKIGWLAELKGNRQEAWDQRLGHLVRMSAQGKRYGTEPLVDWE